MQLAIISIEEEIKNLFEMVSFLSKIDTEKMSFEESVKSKKAELSLDLMKKQMNVLKKCIQEDHELINTLKEIKRLNDTFSETYWLSIGYWVNCISKSDLKFVELGKKTVIITFSENSISRHAIIKENGKDRQLSVLDLRDLIQVKGEESANITNVKESLKWILISFVIARIYSLVNQRFRLYPDTMRIETPVLHQSELQWQISFEYVI